MKIQMSSKSFDHEFIIYPNLPFPRVHPTPELHCIKNIHQLLKLRLKYTYYKQSALDNLPHMVHPIITNNILSVDSQCNKSRKMSLQYLLTAPHI